MGLLLLLTGWMGFEWMMTCPRYLVVFDRRRLCSCQRHRHRPLLLPHRPPPHHPDVEVEG